MQFDFISSYHSTSKDEQIAAFWSFWKGAVLGSIPKLWERPIGQSAHQHRRSEHSAQTWLDTTAQSQRPSDTRTMDLSDRLPIWPPPRNPSTFLAQQRCSAAKGAWVRVECLPLKPPTPPQEINSNPLSWRRRKSGQTVVGYISLKLREWRSLSKLWEVFNLWFNCLLFGISSGWLLITEVSAKSD